MLVIGEYWDRYKLFMERVEKRVDDVLKSLEYFINILLLIICKFFGIEIF